MPWQEDRIHRWLARRARPDALVGSALHDAAVLRPSRGRVVSCCDQTIEGVHFLAEDRPRLVGRKAGARALSDLAATAARPLALCLAIAAPPEVSERWIRAAIEGVDEVARAHGAGLVGGDLAQASGPARLSVHAIGELEGRRRAPGRDRARAGDELYLTGPVGGSLLGRHLRFEPRLDAGRWLFRGGAHALMDVSDGLAWDLHRFARTAGVRFELEHLPIHRDARRAARQSGRDAGWHALHDGEDHELIAALPPARARALEREAARHCPGLVRIGRVREGSGLHLAFDSDGRPGPLRPWRPELERGGWRHGES